jgi:L-seryl-tRNA(Ser) seleniumtransferase
MLREITGAEDAIVVNNCAAALVLALNTLANGREAVISRGELVEIGGSFRIPDIMSRSGARLVEVGTTNRTHLDDYRQALGADTGAIVKVHHSNFEITGFVAEASVAELVELAGGQVPVVQDFGSGLLIPLDAWGLKGEPTASQLVAAGPDLVLMSGDKLLGGPQAGIIVGRKSMISRIATNPLTRAFRVDKFTLAALEATLAMYREPTRALEEVPVLRMITTRADELRERAEGLVRQLEAAGVEAEVLPSVASVGGGAYPGSALESWAVSPVGRAAEMEKRLRAADVPVIARVTENRMLLDLRSVPASQDVKLATVLPSALRA